MKKTAFAFLVFIFLTGQITVDQGRPPVEVADLAPNTDGKLITWDSSGNATSCGPGTANQYFASQGAGAEPIFKSILDEDNMVSDSATDVATQQSIKKYVDDNLGTQMVVVVDEKAANTAGGTFTSGAWQTRTLNTLRVNDDSIASLSSDQITLPAGTYECWIFAPGHVVGPHKIRLQNITATSTIISGSSVYADVTNIGSNRSEIHHKFTLGVSSALEVQHRGTTTKSTDGFGVPSNFGDVETYTVAMFKRSS